MEPITAIQAFATIVQLLGIFKSEKKGEKDVNHRKFIEWLEYHRHEDIKSFITNTAVAQSEIDNLLRQDHMEILSKLASIDATLVNLCFKIEGLSGLARAIVPDEELSEQAISILEQLVKSNSSSLIRCLTHNQHPDYILNGGGMLIITDGRMVDADMQDLAECGLLKSDYNKSGDQVYRITRATVKFVEILKENSIGIKP